MSIVRDGPQMHEGSRSGQHLPLSPTRISCQQLIVGDTLYKVVGSLPTSSNTTIALCLDGYDNLVIVKRAQEDNHIGSGARELRAQIQQMRVLREQLAYTSLYPEILYDDQQTLIIPFYPDGSVYAVLQQEREKGLLLLADALDRLFGVACRAFELSQASPSLETFLADQVARRLKRLELVMASSAAGRDFLACLSSPASTAAGMERLHGERALRSLTTWLNNGTMAEISRTLAPPRSGIAAHGDFVANNILVASSLSSLAFIDVRGYVVWHEGLPWWDPIMDLASMIYFFSIESALNALQPDGQREGRKPLPQREDVLALCRKSQAFHLWISQDAHWLPRLTLYIAIRLLGNVSIQLTYPLEQKLERALAIYNVFVRQFCHCLPILQAFSPGAYDTSF